MHKKRTLKHGSVSKEHQFRTLARRKLMFSRHLKQYSLPPLFILVFLLGLRTVEACSCGASPTVLDSYKWADVVVTVSVASVEKAEPEKTAPPGQMSNGENYVDGVKSTTMRVE